MGTVPLVVSGSTLFIAFWLWKMVLSIKALDMTALGLLIVGGLNWLLVGLLEFDLVATLFGGLTTLLAKFVYVLVSRSALYSIKFFGLISKKTSYL